MGRIRRLDATAEHPLESEHLVGRGQQCALVLEEKYVSAQHCVIRWTGHLWQVLDRGSRNGTRVDGQRLSLGHAHDLKEGSLISFGHSREQWVLSDASGPEVMLVCRQTGLAIPERNGEITVPAGNGVRYTLRGNAETSAWCLFVGESQARVLEPGATLEIAGQQYRFVCPRSVNATCAQEQIASAPVIEFNVSLEREFVHVSLRSAQRTFSLGSRTFNALLLHLAEERLADQAAGRAPGECGWMYKSQLASALHYTPQQVDGDVHRVKEHLKRHALLDEVGELIERRRGTTQLRLALAHIEIRQSQSKPKPEPGEPLAYERRFSR